MPRTCGEPTVRPGLVEGPPGWRTRAACKGMDPNIFFPGRGDTASLLLARATCATCPVAQHCAAYGLTERRGIWGNVSEKQRRRARRRSVTPSDPSPKADATTKAELLRARGQDPAAGPSSATAEPVDPAAPNGSTPSAACAYCEKPLPPDWHRRYCDDRCMHEADRAARRARYSAKPGKTKAKPRTVETNGVILNGLGNVLAEVLAVKGVGSVELELAGTRLLVRPR